MIPKIIHQIWLGDQARRPATWMASWRTQHPDWEYRLWTEAELFDLECAGQFAALPHFAGKADIARYEILHRYGGIYLDADSECVRPLPEHLRENLGFAAWENEYVRPGLVANGVIGARAGCTLMTTLIVAIKRMNPANLRSLPYTEVWRTTGPGLFSAGIQGRLGAAPATQYRIYPSAHFYPEHFSGVSYSGAPIEIYAHQFWSSTSELVPVAARA
jgi:mannosyltransferase OCH1-like enzyme